MLQVRIRYLLPVALVLASPMTAQAAEACGSAKDLVRMVTAFYAADADRVNVITPKANLAFSGINGHPAPTQMLFRHEDKELLLDIDEDGALQGLDKMATFSKDGEMCRVIDGSIPEDAEEDTTSVAVNFKFPYNRTDGQFTIDEVLEGAKDGSKIMKGVAPRGLGFAVPGLKAVYLKPAQEGGPTPVVNFTRNGEPVSVDVTVYNGNQYFRTKDIKSSKADKMTITGNYVMEAGFKFDPDDLAEAEVKRLAEAAEE